MFSRSLLILLVVGSLGLVQAQEIKSDEKDIAAQLKAINNKLDSIKTDSEKWADAIREIQALEKRVKALEDKAKPTLPMPMGPISSNKPEATEGTQLAKLRVVNEFPNEVSIVLNGRGYRLRALTEYTLDIPAGGYTYRLLNDDREEKRYVRPGESAVVRVFPVYPAPAPLFP